PPSASAVPGLRWVSSFSSSRSLDLDAARPRFFRLRNSHVQDTVVVLGPGLVGSHARREPDDAAELPGAALAAVERGVLRGVRERPLAAGRERLPFAPHPGPLRWDGPRPAP